MAKFFEQVKTLMSDVESFMGQTKDTKLTNKAKSLKQDILQQIQDIRQDKPQLSSSTDPTTSRAVPAADDPDDIYEDAENVRPVRDEELLKKDVPASDRNNVSREGNLKYRKEKKVFNKVNIVKSKQWCVIRDRIFYIYDKKSSKKQAECFFVEGYQVTPMEKEGTKKDVVYPFEMTCDDRKTYVFDASSEDEQIAWVKLMHEITGIGARSRPLTSSGPPEGFTLGDDEDEALYEDTGDLLPHRPMVSTSDSPPPTPPSKSGSHTPGRKLPQDPSTQSLSSGGQSSTPSGESMADADQELYDETGVETPQPDYNDELYDETEIQPEPASSPKTPVNKSSLFSESLQRQSRVLENGREPPPPPNKALPPTPASGAPVTPPRPVPTPPPSSPSTPAAPSPANMYYAVWDCKADNTKELSFTRGDIITVLSKQYEDKGWWVSRLHDKVGLVPREYLTEAYERT